MSEEKNRLEAERTGDSLWRKWGPYLSERQWGTVREDYSPHGDAWEYFPHSLAKSRAYRWGEDGIAGISDDKQLLCFAIALWNGKDSILKERLFGLSSQEGNHGEDVKEYYFYLDNLPTHSYMKYLYKYPQSPFPYEQLVQENQKRSKTDFEFELIDTKIFEENRYFDIFVEYAKDTEEDLLIQITAANRGSDAAPLHLLPTLWFRNTWDWEIGKGKPKISQEQNGLKCMHEDLGEMWLYAENPNDFLFTENETNLAIFNAKNKTPFVKDGFHEYLIHKNSDAVNPEHVGTKSCAHYDLIIEPQKSKILRLRLSKKPVQNPFDPRFDEILKKRIQEADEFYQSITPFPLSEDMRNVQRQAFAGLLWNKQCYNYNIHHWIKGDPAMPPSPPERMEGRNHNWKHLDAYDIFSMPDKWEYPWFAAWDLAFHAITFAIIDPEFAKRQLLLLTREWYMHPNGQIPAYEWNFGDVNPPLHAWAAMRIYQIEFKRYGRKDRSFLEKIFQKLTLNFTWWVNRKDDGDRNIFEGGFLGLDNIGSFDRTLGPPAGGTLEQPDGTGWMGMYCLNLLQIALELAIEDPIYEDMATKFFEHFVYIADAINNVAGQGSGLWDEKNGFYYGTIVFPDGKKIAMDEESIVGLIPLFAIATNHAGVHEKFPDYRRRFKWFVENRPEYLEDVGDLSQFEKNGNVLITLVNPSKLEKILQKALDENRFLSPFGIRAVSKYHEQNPFIFELDGKQFRLDYEPAESTTGLFGGNSNWRGPVWLPFNFLLIESLQKFHYYLGDDFKVEYPTGSGKKISLWEVSTAISERIINLFLKDKNGRRPVYGGIEKFQNDPHWKDYILFHEYFHGDNGAGLGASNQTGWTALVAKLIDQYGAYHLGNISPDKIEKEKMTYI